MPALRHTDLPVASNEGYEQVVPVVWNGKYGMLALALFISLLASCQTKAPLSVSLTLSDVDRTILIVCILQLYPTPSKLSFEEPQDKRE